MAPTPHVIRVPFYFLFYFISRRFVILIVWLWGNRKMIPKGGTRTAHHHLIQYSSCQKDIRTTTDMIIVSKDTTIDKRHQTEIPGMYQMCALKLKPLERALILKLSILYTHNDCEEPIVFHVENLFPSINDGDCNHPDQTGEIDIVIPGAHHAGPVPPSDRLLYEPNFVNLGDGFHALQYAGIENHIMNARSTCVTNAGSYTFATNMDSQQEYVAFMYNDPLVVFLMAHKQHFAELKSNDIHITDDIIYLIRKSLVERVQQFFKNAVFPLLHYTETPAVYFRLKNDMCEGAVSFMLQLDYVVISPGIESYHAIGIKLNF